ncbi:chaplin [Streptomyces sp. NPDC052101]|uniref:chaplin n=1 Tax=Streptomyces sp. NPDC052101 TaxID=3155763 RepID=UPI0034150F8D
MRVRAAITAIVLTAAGVVACTGTAVADADANGAAVGSPGVISGNAIQAPIHLPINLCGNSIDIVALLNPTFGNTCVAD